MKKDFLYSKGTLRRKLVPVGGVTTVIETGGGRVTKIQLSNQGGGTIAFVFRDGENTDGPVIGAINALQNVTIEQNPTAMRFKNGLLAQNTSGDTGYCFIEYIIGEYE